jgi:bacterioferritin-associated ferredoxin
MYVCVCKGVTDTRIRQAADDAVCRMRDLRDQLGVATQCGKCAQYAYGILKEAQAMKAECDMGDKRKQLRFLG